MKNTTTMKNITSWPLIRELGSKHTLLFFLLDKNGFVSAILIHLIEWCKYLMILSLKKGFDRPSVKKKEDILRLFFLLNI